MTTKEALELAIIVLQNERSDKDGREATRLLQKLQKREMITRWTQKTILEALDLWRKENGTQPKVTNLIEPGMPGANIIQKHFGMRASAFLRKYYPDDNEPGLPKRNKYGYQSQEDWILCFREQFFKHCEEEGFSSKTYDMFKDEGTPPWMTIARHCGSTQWSKLMELAEVEYPNKRKQGEPGVLCVSSVKSPWLERLEAAVEKREILDQRLIDVIEKNHRRKRK